MTPDPHDEYYARKQAHRAELFSGVGRLRLRVFKSRKAVLLTVALLFMATSGFAGWMALVG